MITDFIKKSLNFYSELEKSADLAKTVIIFANIPYDYIKEILISKDHGKTYKNTGKDRRARI